MKKITALMLTALLAFALCPFAHANGYTVVSEPQFNMAETFESTVTKVSKNTKWALMTYNGIMMTGYEWEAMGEITSEYIPAKKNGKWGYISPEGDLLISYQFSDVGYFKNGLAMAKTEDGKYVYINISGKTKFVSPFDYSFSPSGGAICGMIDGLYGYCDTDGQIFIQPQFDMAFDFHEGYAAVKFGGKWGYIGTDGKYSIRPTYDYASDFFGGFAVVRSGSKYGIINTAGTKTAGFLFDYIGEPDDKGRYPAKSGTTSGYINTSGTWVLKTDYEYCYRFTEGVARVYKNGLWGYIDENGNPLVEPVFADCGEYLNGRAPFSIDGSLWGYLKLNSTVYVPPKEPEIPAPSNPSTPQEPEEQKPVIVITGNMERPKEPVSDRTISMKINSQLALNGSSEYTLASPPVLLNGITMVPVRDIVELLGGSLTWNAETQRINIRLSGGTVSITVGSRICYINGTPGFLTATPVISSTGSTLIPVRSVVDALKCEVIWDGATQNIFINY